MIEEPVLIRRAHEEAQGREHALSGLRTRDVATLNPDRIRGECEADRCDAGERRCRVAVGNEAALRVRGLPEEAKGALLEIGEERIEEHRLWPLECVTRLRRSAEPLHPAG